MKTLTTFLLALISLSTIAQDKIIKKTGAVIDCKVTEIAADEVKYYYAENPKLIFGIDKVLVEKIEFSTGEVIVMEENSFRNPEYYIDQNKRALKINFLSPLMGSTEFVYEQSIKPGRSWETALGIIGLGFDPQDYNPAGFYGKFAFKFIKDPDFYMQRMHYSHILKGAYLAPEIGFRYFAYDSYNYNYYSSYYSESTDREKEFSMAFLLKFGKQWVFDDSFLVDLFGGIGYGIGGDDYDALPYGFIVTPEVPISFTGGLRIGWVF
ncbi:hypothetical protein MASR2M47_26430 [Draconibacterium sp.]|jgi:hypothetical protein